MRRILAVSVALLVPAVAYAQTQDLRPPRLRHRRSARAVGAHRSRPCAAAAEAAEHSAGSTAVAGGRPFGSAETVGGVTTRSKVLGRETCVAARETPPEVL